jgi:hypothetical protein
MLLRSLLLLNILVTSSFVAGFVVLPNHQPGTITSTGLCSTTPEEAAAMTNFMAKAHEEKVAAMARVEAIYKDQIADLEAKLEEMQAPQTALPSNQNSFTFPATNKALAEKVVEYQVFISEYIVKTQTEKQKAVADAEANVKAKYEEKIAALQAMIPLQ